MTEIQQHLKAFSYLGQVLRELPQTNHPLVTAIDKAHQSNRWFTKHHIIHALAAWGKILTKSNIESWMLKYDHFNTEVKVVGIVMAGNLPMVGFHDLMCVLFSGNKAQVKLSKDDAFLIPACVAILSESYPKISENVYFTENKLSNFDVVIATGSNNTARYFEYYFRSTPHIIRKNRHSLAILEGTESASDLQLLCKDIFQYFGLGCRNVSKLWIPKGYDFDPLFNALYEYKHLIDHNAYANNYDYNKAVYLMSEQPILDNGFVILKEDVSFGSPVACLFYSYYDPSTNLHLALERIKNEVQCVVSNNSSIPSIGFGTTQDPKIDDYADGIDTMLFLLKAHKKK